MILIEHQIDLTKIPTFSVNELKIACGQCPDQERLCGIASDGSYLYDSDGQVKLFEMKVPSVDDGTTRATCRLAVPEMMPATNEPASPSDCNTHPVVGSYQRPDITLYDRIVTHYFISDSCNKIISEKKQIKKSKYSIIRGQTGKKRL